MRGRVPCLERLLKPGRNRGVPDPPVERAGGKVLLGELPPGQDLGPGKVLALPSATPYSQRPADAVEDPLRRMAFRRSPTSVRVAFTDEPRGGASLKE